MSQYSASPGLSGFGQSPGNAANLSGDFGESPFAQFASQLPILGTPGLTDAFLPSPAPSAPPWALHGDISPRAPQLRPQRLSFSGNSPNENNNARSGEMPNHFGRHEIFDPFAVQEEPEGQTAEGEFRKPKPKGVRQPNGTSGIVKPCSCKKSRCLKKYCECFASNRYCDGCFCTNCQNVPNPPPCEPDPQPEPVLRNVPVNNGPIAISGEAGFNPNMDGSDLAMLGGKMDASPNIQGKGCHCKKSQCAKKYCECFQLGNLCSQKCECRDCKNKTWENHRSRSPGSMRPNSGIRRSTGKPGKPMKRLPTGMQAPVGYRTTPHQSVSPSEEGADQSDLDLSFSADGLHDAMSPATMHEWANAERGLKRSQTDHRQPVFTPASSAGGTHIPCSSSPAKLLKLSPEDKPADQSDLDITFSAMTEGLDDAMIEHNNDAPHVREIMC